jgi:hypothetical protein
MYAYFAGKFSQAQLLSKSLVKNLACTHKPSGVLRFFAPMQRNSHFQQQALYRQGSYVVWKLELPI